MKLKYLSPIIILSISLFLFGFYIGKSISDNYLKKLKKDIYLKGYMDCTENNIQNNI